MNVVDNDQTNAKNVALVLKGSELSTKVLALAMKFAVKQGKKLTLPKEYNGKQTVKQLVNQGVGVQSIPISDETVKSFENVAKKHGVDYAIVKDTKADPPQHIAFFKARDADAVTNAFSEYSKRVLEAKREREKPPLRNSLEKAMEKSANQEERERNKEKDKNKDRGLDR